MVSSRGVWSRRPYIPIDHCEGQGEWVWKPGIVDRLDGTRLDVLIACYSVDEHVSKVVIDPRTPGGMHIRDLDGNVVRLANRESSLVTLSERPEAPQPPAAPSE